MTSAKVDPTIVPNDGRFITYDAACQRYGLTPKALRELVREHDLTTYKPVAFDRRYYLSIDELEAIPSIIERRAERRQGAIDAVAGSMSDVDGPGSLDQLRGTGWRART